MKILRLLLVAGLVSMLTGCASSLVALAPVGPNPAGNKNPEAEGWLQVFSCLTARSDNDNQGSTDPIWYQHTDYSVYDLQHKLVKRVDNTIGHYEEDPRRLMLAAGQYLVKAHANDYFWVVVPVTIKHGETTRVHLDDDWNIQTIKAKGQVVRLPNGNPVGWVAQAKREGAMN